MGNAKDGYMDACKSPNMVAMDELARAESMTSLYRSGGTEKMKRRAIFIADLQMARGRKGK